MISAVQQHYNINNNNSSSKHKKELLVKHPSYLLQCALTYDWDSLIEFCYFILEDILLWNNNNHNNMNTTNTRNYHHHGASSTTPKRYYVDRCRNQLYQTDQNGNTVLHVVCYNQPTPVEVVILLLQLANNLPSPPPPSPAKKISSSSSTTTNHHPTNNQQQLHTVLSKDNSSPLLIACATGASLPIIRALLNNCNNNNNNNKKGKGHNTPQSNNNNNRGYPTYQTTASTTSATTTYKKLLHGGFLVSISDELGGTPLSELVIQYELQRRQRNNNSLPLDQIPTVDSTLFPPPSNNNNNTLQQQQHPQQQPQNNVLFDQFWAKVQLLIQAAVSFEFNDSDDDDGNNNTNDTVLSIVHGAACIAESCPPVLASLICRSYPKLVSERNDYYTGWLLAPTSTQTSQGVVRNFNTHYGLLPLHFALLQTNTRSGGSHRGVRFLSPREQQQQQEYESNNNSNSNSNSNVRVASSHEITMYRRTFFIQTLLGHDPNTARVVFPNTGRTPLCQAIASGLTWHITTTKYNANDTLRSTNTNNHNNTTHNNKYYLKGTVQLLFEAAPNLLHVRDPVTGFYPFQLAAVDHNPFSGMMIHNICQQQKRGGENKNKTKDSNNDCDVLQLDTIFALLRLHPQTCVS